MTGSGEFLRGTYDAARFGIYRAIAAFRYKGLGAVSPADFFASRSVMVLRPDGIGDMIMTLPALFLLRRLIPNARIDILVRPSAAEVARHAAIFDNIYEFEPRDAPVKTRAPGQHTFYPLMVQLRRNRYDLVIDIAGRSRTRKLGFSIGGRRLVSPSHYLYENPGNNLHFLASDLIAMPEPPRHSVDNFIHVIHTLAGREDSWLYEWPLSSHDEQAARERLHDLGVHGDFVVIHPFSSDELKDWPRERFVEVGSAILDRYDVSLVLSGSAREADLLREMAAAVSQPERCVVAAGALTIVDIAAACRMAKLLVTVDTSVMHAGDIAGAKVVALMLPHNTIAGPYSQPQHVILPACPGETFTQYRTPDDEREVRRIDRIPVADVLERVISALDSAPSGVSHSPAPDGDTSSLRPSAER
ncbi:MAG: glycosyltransferase family 9 protein [Capsulimonadaceae bacterium]|nr:glycosyltransferase family 9 protein [Capsulimonadaceae bacterium]